MTADDFKRIYPIERIYEVPLNKSDRDDVVGESREFELADWRIRMDCIAIDKKKKIAKYKRTHLESFGGVKC
jgi:hypothetical protein